MADSRAETAIAYLRSIVAIALYRLVSHVTHGQTDWRTTRTITIAGLHVLADQLIIIIIYYKIVHKVHDRQTYSKNNKNSKREH